MLMSDLAMCEKVRHSGSLQEAGYMLQIEKNLRRTDEAQIKRVIDLLFFEKTPVRY